MMRCTNCGSEIPEETRFCPWCGAEAEPARETPETAPVETLTARPSWEDAVGHVNNFRYGEMVYDALSPEQRGNMENLQRLELYFVSETKPGDTLTLHRVDEGADTTVTVTLPEQTRPAFAAKLRFRA